jgi:hypothetical protein
MQSSPSENKKVDDNPSMKTSGGVQSPRVATAQEKPSGFPISPLSGIFSLAADKLGSLVGSPRNHPQASTFAANKDTGSKEDEFDIVQLEWTDSEKESSNAQSHSSDNSERKN